MMVVQCEKKKWKLNTSSSKFKALLSVDQLPKYTAFYTVLDTVFFYELEYKSNDRFSVQTVKKKYYLLKGFPGTVCFSADGFSIVSR
jgi:hypothetical protein